MRTLIDKINAFENGMDLTVKEFNKIFPECALTLNVKPSDEVEIGEICTPETSRLIYVNGKERRHDFKPMQDSLENLEHFDVQDEFEAKWKEKKSSKPKMLDVLSKTPTNSDGVNKVMSPLEMKLKPTIYMLLQYLKGCQNPYHQFEEIAKNLDMSRRTVSECFKAMKDDGMIKINKVAGTNGANCRVYIEVSSQWK
jgi:biotin operon repressor